MSYTTSITGGSMAEVYEKGQVLIPKYIRDALRITPGTKVNVRLEGNRAVIDTSESFFEEFEQLTSNNKSSGKETARLIEKSKKSMERKWLDVPRR